MRYPIRCIAAAVWVISAYQSHGDVFLTRPKERMMKEHIEGRGIQDPYTLEALRKVPRHEFVPEHLVRFAYEDRPLPIEHGQTISQPYIVAAMTELLGVKPGDVVLEVGSGSGYQAAVLAEFVGHVYTIEIIPELARTCAERLSRLGYTNVTVKAGDGYAGWPEHAPFDGIIVTAGAPHVPQPLIEQLKPGARMVIPVGLATEVQHLMLIEKLADGTIQQRSVMPVRFVPLTGER